MGDFRTCMYILMVGLPIHIFLCYFLMFTMGMGHQGSAVSISIVFCLQFVFVTLYLSFKKGAVPVESWHFFNADSFKGWPKFLKYGVPSAILQCMDGWTFAICGLFAGIFGAQSAGSNMILQSLTAIFYMIACGMSNAISNLVGSSLGESKPYKAKKYSVICIL